jgi:hypothetical protein
MTFTAAIQAGYRPIRRVHECVLMLAPTWEVITVIMTFTEESAYYCAVADAKQWAIETYGNGRRMDGDAMRPLLAWHVLSRGSRWVETRV